MASNDTHLVHSEWEGHWKEADVVEFEVRTQNFPEEREENHETFRQITAGV
jgi:RNA binding exosome subunit